MIADDSDCEFVELGRTFHELSKYAHEEDDVDLSSVFHIGKALDWPNLLKEYRTIILSEAGSGKTTEIRTIARKLRDEGKAAFFIRLEHIPNYFEDSFEVGSFEDFQRWLASGEDGWLLLDSVDEARLRNPGDFELAIRKLGRRLVAARERTHIVITGRTEAWRPKTDYVHCVKHLPFITATREVLDNEESEEIGPVQNFYTEERKKVEPSSNFKVVALDDLSSNQIEVFCKARKLTDTKAFLNAVERADAWSFTARPQDLEEVTEFWKDHGRIGSRLEIMLNSIERRLTERDQNRADARPLSTQKARQGAKLIAAAATLAREPTIRVPDGANNTRGISIGSVLPDWDDKEQLTLLSRPIFDEAIYGTVRFHHRSVREYLTAEWFADLLKRETSRRKIEALFFRNQYGIDVVVPAMRPILPWLAILDDKVRERVQKIAPEVILEGGDPSQLPLYTRRSILHEVCNQFSCGTSNKTTLDYTSVQRFANTDLSSDVRDLIKKHFSNDDIIAFLLRMVWLGQLTEALPEANNIVISTSVSEYTRITAIKAVKAIASREEIEELLDHFLHETAQLERNWLAELVKDVQPSPDSIAWLMQCLAKSKPKERFSYDPLTDSVVSFVAAAPIDLLPAIISGLNQLLAQAPFFERRHCEVSEKFGWLIPAASQGVERLIQGRHTAALYPDALAILHKHAVAKKYQMDDIREGKFDFASLVSSWPDLNRALFWRDVGGARDKRSVEEGRVSEFWQASMLGGFWSFNSSDLEYAVNEISNRTLQDDKLVALSLAYRLYIDAGRPRIWRDKLKKLVAYDPELTETLRRYLNPLPQSREVQNWRRQENVWKRRDSARKKREEEIYADWKHHITSNVEKLRDPRLRQPTDISQFQHYLHERVREKHGGSTRWTPGVWKPLIVEYGEEVARAYRDGVVAYWRRYKPTVQSENAPQNSTPFPVIFGLTGLEIEAYENSDWPKTLTPEEVVLACRYASYELNGFPTWLPKLFEFYPKLVADFLLQEISYEISIATSREDSNYILSDVSWSGEWAWGQLGPSIHFLLEAAEPKNLSELNKLLKIMQGSNISDEQIGSLAAEKVRTALPLEHAAQWYAVWTGVDPAVSIPSLEAYFDSLTDPDDCVSLAMNFVTHLWGGRKREPTRVRDAFKTPQHLTSLYLLMHKHIRQQDDIDRAGKGVYSPTLRDNAQDSRNSLFELLNAIPGKESFLALDHISKVHPDEESRSWFAHHARQKAEREANIQPWMPSQVWDFNERLERTPSNHRELAELATMRLLDLKDDLEEGDSSIAGILRGVTSEREVRKYIGRELREKAFSRYSIPQEEELADARKPDLRFHGVGFDGPIPVELKLADNDWSGPDLFERLENQLCGDYLRDNRSNRGLFVLVYRGEKTGWDLPGSNVRVDFNGLIAGLQAHWERISTTFSGIEDITIIGIDLTKRCAVRKASTPLPL